MTGYKWLGIAIFIAQSFIWAHAARASELITGPLPISLAPENWDETHELFIKGEIKGNEPVTVVLRLDDKTSFDYGSRMNMERQLLPGTFHWYVSLKGLRTTGGRPLNIDELEKLVLFSPDNDDKIIINTFEIAKVEPYGNKVSALSLGAEGAPLFPGFERLGPNDKRLSGETTPIPVSRPGVDALIGNGLKNLSEITLEAEPGPSRLTLWLEDPGEWETLPPALSRRILANGEEIYAHQLSPQEWLGSFYLNGGMDEPASRDAWAEIGSKRGQRISRAITIPASGKLVLRLAGDSPTSTFLSGILIEPIGEGALEKLEAKRAERFRSQWPVGDDKPLTEPVDLALEFGTKTTPQMVLTAAPGVVDTVRISASTPNTINNPMVQVGKNPFNAKIWAHQKRIDREAVNANLLRLTRTTLRTDASAFPIEDGEPRFYSIALTIPEDLATGRYPVAVYLTDPATAEVASGEILVEVLPITLPKPLKPAGFYHDEAPHLNFFGANEGARLKQGACDLDFLAELGITGNAPMLSTPVANRKEQFITELQNAMQSANQPPYFAYASAKRLVAELGSDKAVEAILALEQELEARGIPAPIWAVADEPGNPAHAGGLLESFNSNLKKQSQTAKTAAQLNRKRDRELAHLFDVALVNPGFGVDAESLENLEKKGVEPWLYNTGNPRLSAGFWLFHTPAKRYVQWHARMPTAHPFDPTDGREGDVMGLIPTLEICPEQPDIHISVLDMAAGILDQRWLLWLEGITTPEAEYLKSELKFLATHDWKVLANNEGLAKRIRSEIQTLARNLNISQ